MSTTRGADHRVPAASGRGRVHRDRRRVARRPRVFLLAVAVSRPASAARHHTDAPFVFVADPAAAARRRARRDRRRRPRRQGARDARRARRARRGAATARRRHGRHRDGVLPARSSPGACSGPASASCSGATTLFASALLTGGVGPWLPFQMFACGVGRARAPACCRVHAGAPRSRCSRSTASSRHSRTGSC